MKLAYLNSVIFGFILIFVSSFSSNKPRDIDVIFFCEDYLSSMYPDSNIKEYIFVSIKNQKLYLIRYNNVISSYDVSTSKYGVGNKMHSLKTPTGLHKITKKIGNGVPLNGIIEKGLFTNEKAQLIPEEKRSEEDIISTRVLWLEGLEDKVNKGDGVDSYLRRIYIHGTNEEWLIGRPSSHGCIRMRNYDVLELFELAEKEIKVLILDV